MNKTKELKEELIDKQPKREWKTPEVIDLNIQDGTKNNNSGPSFNDGGPAFADYTS